MFYSPKMYLQDKYIAIAHAISVVILGFAWWITVSHFHQTSESVFLHYNIIFGIDLIGEWWQEWYVAGFGSAMFVFNTLASFALYQRQKFYGQFCAILTSIIMAVMYVGLYFIVGLNS